MTAQLQPHNTPETTSTSTQGPYLQVKKLWKHYGYFAALREVSLEIEEGEFVCFLGPSGCGKTTLLRAIAGLDPQSRGEIIQGGTLISNLPPEQRDFGIVFQSYALFPNLTVAENIGYGLRNTNMKPHQITQKVITLLDTIGLPDVAKKYPVQLSGGQQQRVALARALATEPSLLLLDEPLSALDARVRLHLRQEIRHLQRKLGITTIMVTHDQEEALAMADRIVVMNHGIIEQVGSPETVYRHPANAFVANFVGTMNLIATQAATHRQVRCKKRLINCRSYQPKQTGLAWLAFRPEVARLQACHSPQTDTSCEYFAASVIHIEFLGSFLRVEVQVPELQHKVLVDVSTQNLDINLYIPHQAVTLVIPVIELQVFKRAQDTLNPASSGSETPTKEAVA